MKSYCNQAVCQAPLGIALRLLWVGTKSRVTSPLLRWLQSFIIASIVTLCGIPARQGLARGRRKTSGRNDTIRLMELYKDCYCGKKSMIQNLMQEFI